LWLGLFTQAVDTLKTLKIVTFNLCSDLFFRIIEHKDLFKSSVYHCGGFQKKKVSGAFSASF